MMVVGWAWEVDRERFCYILVIDSKHLIPFFIYVEVPWVVSMQSANKCL